MNEDAQQNTDKEKTAESEDEIIAVLEVHHEDRQRWGNKVEFILATVGFSVGLGNVWRFPYLCQKNGGGAFLIPYMISLFLIGIPLFYLELGIGQRIRQGSIQTWNYIHPYLGGIGYSCAIICMLFGMYYNMVIAWCFYYLFASWQSPLPYENCPWVTMGNKTILRSECALAGNTKYYWYKEVLAVSDSIETSGGMSWHLALTLSLAWIVVLIILVNGRLLAGKGAVFTAISPYIVLIIFFVRAVKLEGAGEGIKHMFRPQREKLTDPQVWLEAATQILFSLSLGFGSFIAMSGFNRVHYNYRRDAIVVPVVNCATSLLAGMVIFSVLGFKANSQLRDCRNQYTGGTLQLMANETVNSRCHNISYWLSKTGAGPGLIFIAITDAIVQLPVSPLFGTLFFLMLLILGIGTMVDTLKGVIVSFYDTEFVPWVHKKFPSAAICMFCFLVGLIFCRRSGEYWMQMFDTFSVTFPLLIVGLFELIAVVWVYGLKRFEDDIEHMLGARPSIYFRVCWKYVSPAFIVGLLVTSLGNMIGNPIKYSTWNFDKEEEEILDYPSWCYACIILLVTSSFVFIPGIFVLRYFGIIQWNNSAYQRRDNIWDEGMTSSPLRMSTVDQDSQAPYIPGLDVLILNINCLSRIARKLDQDHLNIKNWEYLAWYFRVPPVVKAKCQMNMTAKSPTRTLFQAIETSDVTKDLTVQRLCEVLMCGDLPRPDVKRVIENVIPEADRHCLVYETICKNDDLLEKIGNKLDPNSSVKKSCRKLGEELGFKREDLDIMEQVTNPSYALLEYIYSTNPDLTLQMFRDKAENIEREDLKRLMDSECGLDLSKPMKEAFPLESNQMRKLCGMLNKGLKNWKQMAFFLGIVQEVYDAFDPKQLQSPTRLLLDWKLTVEEDFTIDAFCQILREMDRKDVVDIIEEEFPMLS